MIAALAAGLICLAGLEAATVRKKKPAHPKAVAAPSAKKPAPARRATRKTSAHAAVRPTPAAHAAPRSAFHSSQTAPTPERYKQFQEALIAKGYLHGEATGQWNEASVDAMRRFQKDQNLEPTGKPNQSLSIIALGLGPKY